MLSGTADEEESSLPVTFLDHDGKIDELPVAGTVVDEVGAQP